jgi:hypothetical protein
LTAQPLQPIIVFCKEHARREVIVSSAILTGWIYDHLLPHADHVKVTHPNKRAALIDWAKDDGLDDPVKLRPLYRRNRNMRGFFPERPRIPR